MRRPSPVRAVSIGVWDYILYALSMWSVLSNAYILTYHYSNWFLDDEHKELRIFMLILFLFVSFFSW